MGIVIFGNSGTAELTNFYLRHDTPHKVIGFTVDEKYIAETTFLGLPVVPFEYVATIFPPSTNKIIVNTSYQQVNKLRAAKYLEAKNKGYQLLSYISSKATIWARSHVGENTFVYENSVIQPFVELKNNIVIAPKTLISHGSVVQDHSFIAANAVLLGRATVESYSFIGASATVGEGVTIAESCIIGAGVTMLHDTEARGVYVGSPAKRLSFTSDKLSTWLTWSAT